MTASKHRGAGSVACAALATASLAGSLAIAVTLGPTPPARAGGGYVNDITTTPVTWVDDQGRQLMVVSNEAQTLQVVRDTAIGDPDLTWGQNGSRQVVYDLPAGASWTSGVMAATDAGIVTLVHLADGCDSVAPCDVWLQQVDGETADTVGGPFPVQGTLGPWRPLDDGSLLMRTADDHLRWVGPDGSDRGDLAPTAPQVADADVDAAGRLLVVTKDGTLTRTPVGAAADLTLATGCDQEHDLAAVGASPAAPGFAVACDPGTGGVVRATRYADGGAVEWTAGATAPNAPDGYPTEVTVTATGTVWVGVRTPTVEPSEPTVGLISASPATSAGWGPRIELRKTGQPSYYVLGPIADFGGGVAQLRPIGSTGEVAVADLRVCCRYPNNTTADFAAHSSVIPYRKGPPRCSAAPVQLRSPSAGTLRVDFQACPRDVDPIRRPTGYRVDLVVDGVTTTKTVPDQGSMTHPTTTFAGIANGKRANVTVTPFNAEGDTSGLTAAEGTIFPFGGAADFVGYQAQHLAWRNLSASQLAPYYYAVVGGSRTPGSVMDEFLTDGTARKSVEPMYRIYRAAFLRDADPSGLRYWVGRHRSGVRVAVIAEAFTRSSEFTRRYGSLTNRLFVERIYQNVLGRAGDPSGIAFWTNRLDTKKATRGSMLASFSESNEFVRTMLGRAQVTTVAFLMLDRTPTATELTTWSGLDDVYATVPIQILATEVYAERTRHR